MALQIRSPTQGVPLKAHLDFSFNECIISFMRERLILIGTDMLTMPSAVGEEQLLLNPILKITEPYSSMILAIGKFPAALVGVAPQEKHWSTLIQLPGNPKEYVLEWAITGYWFKLRYTAEGKDDISLGDFTTTLNPPPNPELSLIFENNQLDSITLGWQPSPETHQTIFDLLGGKNSSALARFLDKVVNKGRPPYDYETVNFLFKINLTDNPQLYYREALRHAPGSTYNIVEYNSSLEEDDSKLIRGENFGYLSPLESIDTADFLQILTSTLALIPTTPLRPVC